MAVRPEDKCGCKSMGLWNVSRSRANCHVYVDFDGTIVPGDPTDSLFDRFAPPQWRDIEQELQDGKIGSRECVVRQVALLRASQTELLRAVDEFEIDPGFAEFVATCRAAGVGVSVVSDGFDLVIAAMLRRNRLDVPYFANHLYPARDNGWRVAFPHAASGCVALSGHCKCSRTEAHAQFLKVVIGDGRSDFCISARADMVFAKATLQQLCREAGRPHVPFRNFSDVTPKLVEWLAQRLSGIGVAAAGSLPVHAPAAVLSDTSQEATFTP